MADTETAIETPALLVDLDVMEANIRRWQAVFDEAGVAFRPHIKTHKSTAVAACQVAARGAGGCQGVGSRGLCRGRVSDLSVAYSVIGESKWRRLAELARDCTMTVNVDSEMAVRGINDAAVAAGSEVGILLDINIGGIRTGIQPAGADALAQLIVSLPGLRLEGITGYRGATYPGAGGRTPAEVGREEGELLVQIADRLRAAGLPIRTVAAGSTPTAWAVALVPGITEVRAGTYVFGDRFMAGLGAHTEDDIALSALCTVSSRPFPERATIDGGTKTFSGDIPGGALPGLQGYARALEIDAYIEAMNEEHGMLRLAPGVDPQVGDRLHLIPNHACTTVNLSDELIGIRDGRIVTVWPIEARGKRT